MRVLEELSGRWVGFWIQEPDRGYMGISLKFTAGRILGEGIDQIGAFDFQGTYTTAGSVKMLKRYPSHRVRYLGNWDGRMIFGKWNIGIWDKGEFEIWPETEAEEMAFEARELEMVGPTPASR